MFSDPAVQRLLVRCGFVLLGLAALVFGLWLAWRARRSGRRGSAPHCFQCGYNLTGLSLPDPSQRCPECGTDLSTPRTVARGRPTVHRPMLGVAVVLMITGGLITVGLATRIYRTSWITVKPSGWLLEDARAGSGLTPVLARYTLVGRMERGGLSAEHTHAFIEHVLELQARPRLTGQELTAVKWLGTWAAEGRLSPEQMERFLDNIEAVGLEVRPRVPDGSPISVRLWAEMRTSYQFGVEVEVLSLTCDGQEVVPDLGRAYPVSRLLGHVDRTLQLPSKVLGPYELRATVRVRVYAFDSQAERFSDEPMHEMTREVRAKFEVVAKPPEDLIQLRPDPALTEVVRSSFVLQKARASRSETGSAEIALLMWAQERMPVNVAFEVLGEFGGQSLFFGYVTGRAGERPWLQGLQSRTFTTVPDVIRIRLVTSIDAALSDPNLAEVWDGEIDLGTISVEGAENVREWISEGQPGE